MALAGQLAEAVNRVRDIVNDAGIAAKYGTSRVIKALGEQWNTALGDLNQQLSKNPLYAEYQITVNTTDRTYMIPSGTAGIIAVEVRESSTGGIVARIPCFGYNDVYGPNFVVKPPFIIFDAAFPTTMYVSIIYTPNALEYMQEASVTEAAFASPTTLVLTTTLNYGDFDPRPNAYIGGMVRVFTGTVNPAGYGHWPWQERYITGYVASSRTITVNKAWDFTIPAATIKYEIVPMCELQIMSIAILYTARMLLSLEGRASKAALVEAEARRSLNAARRHYGDLNRVKEPGATNHLDRKGGTSMLPSPIRTITI